MRLFQLASLAGRLIVALGIVAFLVGCESTAPSAPPIPERTETTQETPSLRSSEPPTRPKATLVSTPSPSPLRSISRPLTVTDAISLARQALTHPDEATIWGWGSGQWADVYREFHFGRDWPPPDVAADDDLVWAVAFRTPVIITGPEGAETQTRTGLVSTFLDYETGEFLSGSTYAPSSPSDIPPAMFGSEPIIEPLRLSISNQTTLPITLEINGQLLPVFRPGAFQDPVNEAHLPEAPWHVRALTPTGRLLLSLDVGEGDIWRVEPGEAGATGLHGVGARAELSCGRLDIWAGPPLMGPAPPANFPPGDCDP